MPVGSAAAAATSVAAAAAAVAVASRVLHHRRVQANVMVRNLSQVYQRRMSSVHE
ncbi:hypothetical protein SLEP1_g29729 [Rubroshorea leprosula]|uniref:Secreted protein n=1 Tax=Rubroshorea leprosula TaxID=152421 RepID=A0AAV5K6Q3_9ROSI|nr:hypothetical protein SLEP1_g29729 [Rubroshorea leprosula]